MINLPKPVFKGQMSLEEALNARRTLRSFAPTTLSLNQLSQLLWATYGMTDPRRDMKTTPSAGALYPLDCYLAAGDDGVNGLEGRVYHYLPSLHALEAMTPGDRRQEIARASLSQMWMAKAPVMVIITAEYERITGKYRERGIRYAHMEVGHAGENLFLQCVALGLGAGIVGAFGDDAVADAVGLSPGHEPFLIVPIGYPADSSR